MCFVFSNKSLFSLVWNYRNIV